MTKTRQKLHKKICEIVWVRLMLATIWQVSEMQRMQSQETEIMQICWNLPEKFVKPHQVNSFCVRFKQFETTAMSAVLNLHCSLDSLIQVAKYIFERATLRIFWAFNVVFDRLRATLP